MPSELGAEFQCCWSMKSVSTQNYINSRSNIILFIINPPCTLVDRKRWPLDTFTYNIVEYWQTFKGVLKRGQTVLSQRNSHV